MKSTPYFLILGAALLLASSCTNEQAARQPEPAGLLRTGLQPEQYTRALDRLALINAASEQSGLTALTLSSGDAHSWQELDAYYQKVDALPYEEAIRHALKEKAIFGLVEMHQLLDKAPLEKRIYYADQFFAQQHVDPNLAIAFLKNLQTQWPAKKWAAAKAKTNQQLQTDLVRTNRKLPSNTILPNTEQVRKAVASVEKQQLARAQKLQGLQQRLAAL